jgi:mRNA-degrading endonuclease RelE of RelBE toxin-antitoxin system
MTYSIKWSNIVLSELSRLPDDIADRITKKLNIQAVGHRKNIYKKYKTD